MNSILIKVKPLLKYIIVFLNLNYIVLKGQVIIEQNCCLLDSFLINLKPLLKNVIIF